MKYSVYLSIFLFSIFIFSFLNFSDLIYGQASSTGTNLQKSTNITISKSISNNEITSDGSAIIVINITPLNNNTLRNISILDVVPPIFNIQPSDVVFRDNMIKEDIPYIDKSYKFMYSITPKTNIPIKQNWTFSLSPAQVTYEIQDKKNIFPPEFSTVLENITLIPKPSESKWYDNISANVLLYVIVLIALSILSGFLGGIINYVIGYRSLNQIDNKNIKIASSIDNLTFNIKYDDYIEAGNSSNVRISCYANNPTNNTKTILCYLYYHGKNSGQDPLEIIPSDDKDQPTEYDQDFLIQDGSNLRILINNKGDSNLVIPINVTKANTLKTSSLAGIAAGLITLLTLMTITSIVANNTYPVNVVSIITLIVSTFIAGFIPFQILDKATGQLKDRIKILKNESSFQSKQIIGLTNTMNRITSTLRFKEKTILPILYKRSDDLEDCIKNHTPSIPSVPPIGIENNVNYALKVMREQYLDRIKIYDKVNDRYYILYLKDLEYSHINKNLQDIVNLMRET